MLKPIWLTDRTLQLLWKKQKNTFQLKCSTGSYAKTPITYPQKKSEITFLLQKGEKKSERYEVEIKTNWHAYFILMNLTDPINCTAVVGFLFYWGECSWGLWWKENENGSMEGDWGGELHLWSWMNLVPSLCEETWRDYIAK